MLQKDYPLRRLEPRKSVSAEGDQAILSDFCPLPQDHGGDYCLYPKRVRNPEYCDLGNGGANTSFASAGTAEAASLAW